MNLQQNDFELLGLPVRFALDPSELSERWKALQREAHPDRHAAAGEAARRVAMQWSARINEAYQRLRDPVRRAVYLCELHGEKVDGHGAAALPPDLLMRQMTWHEQLEEAVEQSNTSAADALAADVAAVRCEVLSRAEHLLDQAHDYTGAAAQLRTLMFVNRMEATIRDRLDAQGQ